MTKTVYIHIGSDKAGSSSLQYFLHANREKLAEAGCWLLRTESIAEAGHPFLFQDLSNPAWTDALKEIDEAPAGIKTFILSWEGIHFFGKGQLEHLRRLLGRRQLKFVYYIREQAPLVQSGMLQELKNGNLNGVQIPNIGIEHPLLTPETRDYAQVIALFEAVFGEDCVIPRVFERDQLVDGDIKTDFLQQIGVERGADFADPADLNPSLSVEAGMATQMLDRLFADPEGKLRLRDLMLRLSTRRQGSKYFLAKPAVEKIRQHYAESNQRVAQRFFGRESLFELKDAHNPGRYNKRFFKQFMKDFFKIWPEFPTVKPNADLELFHEQFGEVRNEWRIEGNVAVPTVEVPRLRFRAQVRFLLPQHRSISVKLRAAGKGDFRCRVLHAGAPIGEVSGGEKIFLPLTAIEPFDCFDLQLEPLEGAEKLKLVGVSWSYEEREV